MEWRELYGTDELIEKWEVPEIIRLYMPGGWFGYDKAGHPIWFELLGYLDVKSKISHQHLYFHIYSFSYPHG